MNPAVRAVAHRRGMRTDTDRCLSHRLDREWELLCHRPHVVARVRSWRLTTEPFASLDQFLVLTGHRAPSTREADRLLGRLVAVAAAEPLACRIVLQRILPGLLSIVKAEQSRDPRVDAFDLLIGEAWISIVRYRTDARPTNVAARLLNDARHRAFTSLRRQRVVEEVTCDDDETFDDRLLEPEPSPFEEVVEVLTEARGCGLADAHVETVCDVLNLGSPARVALVRSVTDRAVRYRQRRAVTQIRRLVAA